MAVTLELEPDVELTATKQAEAEGLPLAKYVEVFLRKAVFKHQRVRCNPIQQVMGRERGTAMLFSAASVKLKVALCHFVLRQFRC